MATKSLMTYHMLDIPDDDFHKHQKIIDKVLKGHIKEYKEYTNLCRILQIDPTSEETFDMHF